MRNSFGDYRSKMLEEERKMAATAGRVQFQTLPSTSKSQFLRKAIIKPTGEEFRFNFKVEELSLNDSAGSTVAVPSAEATDAHTAPVNTFHYQPSNNGFRFNFNEKE